MERKDIWRPLACLCLMAFLTGLPVLAGASSGEGIYGRELDTLYDMIQGGRDPDSYGEDRDAWYYLGNGRFLNQGAGGAGLSILGEYHLDGDGNLVCESCTFTNWDPVEEKEEVYWNNHGVPDRALSKKQAMTPGQFFELQKERMGKVETLSWQSLAWWGKGSVEFSLIQPGEFREPLLAVIPRETLEDVHLLTLQVEEVSDSGQVTWQVETDEPLGNLEPGTRYNYPINLEGTARATGLSYYDRKGYHRKILQLSGEDGSLVVREE